MGVESSVTFAFVQVAMKAMATLEAQLNQAQGVAHKSDRERQQLQHQIIASSILSRHQVGRLLCGVRGWLQ